MVDLETAYAFRLDGKFWTSRLRAGTYVLTDPEKFPRSQLNWVVRPKLRSRLMEKLSSW